MGSGPMPMEATGMDAWIEQEVGACPFPDRRLEKRFQVFRGHGID